MNPIEEIKVPTDAITQWQLDGVFDDTALDSASLQIPYLHGRYLRYLSDARLRAKRLYFEKRKLGQMLREYYSGNLNDPKALETINRHPMLQRYLKSDLGSAVDADDAMLAIDGKLVVADETVAVLEEILKNINGRGFQIKNAIEWRRLTNFSPI